MLVGLSFALALVAYAEAGRNYAGVRLGRRAAFNDTGSSYSNTSTTTTTTPSPSASSITLTTTSAFNSSSSSSRAPSAESTKSDSNGTSGGETCLGHVTYYGSVPPTVYITITEGFEVTVTASNASVTDGATLITPPPACQSTILPLLGTSQPVATVELSLPLNGTTTSKAVQLVTATSMRQIGDPPKSAHPDSDPDSQPGAPVPPKPPPPAQSEPGPLISHVYTEFTVISSTIYATAPYTSTVVVTKKTPVVVVSPQTSSPPVFQDPSPNQNNDPPNQDPGGSNPSSPNAPSNNNPDPPTPDAPANNRPSPPAPSPGPAIIVPGPGPTTTAALGGVIVSLIRTQGFTPASPAAPQTTIANIPVAVLPSTILLGSSPIAIPQSDEAIATVNGQVFTVRPSEIVAADTTLAIAAIPVAPAPTFSTNVEIAPGITAQVSGSAAIIAGTTYRIGYGATPTTITIGGVPVGIGPFGLTLPSTTVAVNALTDAPMVVESAGGLVFSIDQSEVVVDGTTFRIGSGAPTIMTEIDGQTISIGPGGVGVGSTTLRPTGVSAVSGSRSTAGVAATNSVGSDNGGMKRVQKIGVKSIIGWLLLAGLAEMAL